MAGGVARHAVQRRSQGGVGLRQAHGAQGPAAGRRSPQGLTRGKASQASCHHNAGMHEIIHTQVVCWLTHAHSVGPAGQVMRQADQQRHAPALGPPLRAANTHAPRLTHLAVVRQADQQRHAVRCVAGAVARGPHRGGHSDVGQARDDLVVAGVGLRLGRVLRAVGVGRGQGRWNGQCRKQGHGGRGGGEPRQALCPKLSGLPVLLCDVLQHTRHPLPTGTYLHSVTPCRSWSPSNCRAADLGQAGGWMSTVWRIGTLKAQLVTQGRPEQWSEGALINACTCACPRGVGSSGGFDSCGQVQGPVVRLRGS